MTGCNPETVFKNSAGPQSCDIPIVSSDISSSTCVQNQKQIRREMHGSFRPHPDIRQNNNSYSSHPNELNGVRKRKLGDHDEEHLHTNRLNLSPGLSPQSSSVGSINQNKFYGRSPPNRSFSPQPITSRSFDFSSPNGSPTVNDTSGVDLLFAARKPLTFRELKIGMNVKVKHDDGKTERGRLMGV